MRPLPPLWDCKDREISADGQIPQKENTTKCKEKSVALCLVYVLRQYFCGFVERFYRTAVHPLASLRQFFAAQWHFVAYRQVEVHNGERANTMRGGLFCRTDALAGRAGIIAGRAWGFTFQALQPPGITALEIRKDGMRNDMNAGEGTSYGSHLDFHLTGRDIGPPTQKAFRIEEQIAACGPLVDEERCADSQANKPANLFIREVRHIQLPDVDVADDVHVVNQHRIVVGKEWKGLQQCASGVEQEVTFVGDADVGVEVIVLGKETHYLVAEVMDIDDDMVKARCAQLEDIVLQKRLSVDFDQSLGPVVCERAQPSTETGCKNQGIH